MPWSFRVASSLSLLINSSESAAAGSADAAGGGAAGWAWASCSANFCCWRRFTRPETADAVPAMTAVLPTVRITGRRPKGIVLFPSVLFRSLCRAIDRSALDRLGQLGQGGLDEFRRDASRVDDDTARLADGLDQWCRPQVFPNDDQGCVAGREVLCHVVQVLLVYEPSDLAVQVAEGRQLVALVELEADGVAGLVLGHEDQVEDAHRAVGDELLNLWSDVPVEAVAGKGDHRVADWSKGHTDLLVFVWAVVRLSWPAPLPFVPRTPRP